MRRTILLIAASATLLAGCNTAIRLTSPSIDLSEFPPEMPSRIVTDLSEDSQATLQRGLQVIDRELGPVCTPRELAVIRESLLVFGWITASTKPDLLVQTYVNNRAPLLQRERDALNPRCRARLDALVEHIRDTRFRLGRA